MSEATRILESIQQGNPKAAEELLPLVYGELRKLAAQAMARERPGQTLQPTALVHEAWLRLVGPEQQRWDPRNLKSFYTTFLPLPDLFLNAITEAPNATGVRPRSNRG